MTLYTINGSTYLFDPHRSGLIPPKYKASVPADLDSPFKQDLFTRAMKGESMFLHGGPGVGKSFLGFLAAKYMTGVHKDISHPTRYVKSVQYVSFPELVIQLQSSFSEGKSAADILTNLSRDPNFLFLDDLGADGLTDFVRRAIYFIINERDLCQRQTIITSNFSLAEIDAMIDPRISSRIAGMCTLVEMGGKDRRMK